MDEQQRATRYASRLVAIRRYPVQVLREKLQSKGFDEVCIRQVIEHFLEYKLLDDADYARSWVSYRNRVQPRSERVLQLELRKKGIGDSDIAAALAAHRNEVGNEPDLLAARRAAEKAFHRYAVLDKQTGQRRLGGYLQRKGFSGSVISRILRELWT
jgi:regulatory protein